MEPFQKKRFYLFFSLPLAAFFYYSSGAPARIQNQAIVNRSKQNTNYTIPSDTFINNLLANNPQLFNSIIPQVKELGIQVIYTQIDRGKKEKDKVKFTDFTFGLDANNYFYPASTVKLPIAILALQRLNELKIAGLDKNTTMITGAAYTGETEVMNDPSAADGRPTIAHYIKKILLVSDNDAFNRLYEFLGSDYINTSLHAMGYKDVQIIHRLSVSLTEDQNRHTNPVSFFDSTGKMTYRQPLVTAAGKYEQRTTKMGNGYMQGDKLINEPFDFSAKNRLGLEDLHKIVRSIFFPGDIPKEEQFNLTQEDYDFLRRYMSMRPGESISPVYNASAYWDNYVKMLFYGSEKTKPEPGIRIFSKTGTAYGFLIEAAYFADFKNNIEFMLSAVIYCNSDGIFNDDKYDYDTVGYPFLKNLGRVIYEYELKRQRKYPADLSSFQFSYTE